LLRLQSIAFGIPQGKSAPVRVSILPIFAHLALVAIAGIYLSPVLVHWFQHVANMLG
jgi:hydrogenase-4 component F